MVVSNQQSAISTLRCKVSHLCHLWFPLTEFKVSIHCKYLVAITCSCYVLCATSSPQTRPSNELNRVSRITSVSAHFPTEHQPPAWTLNHHHHAKPWLNPKISNLIDSCFGRTVHAPVLSILKFSLCIRACIHYQITNIHRIPILNLDLDWFDSSGLLIPASR